MFLAEFFPLRIAYIAEQAFTLLSLTIIVGLQATVNESVSIFISLPPIVDSFLFHGGLVLPGTIFLHLIPELPSEHIESFFIFNEALQRCEQAHRDAMAEVAPLSH